MKNPVNTSEKISPKVNALIIVDIQEKIINPVFNKDSITKNIKKLIDAYQILEENIFVSEQNPLKLGKTIPELLPKGGFNKIEKMEFSLANIKEFLKELKNKKITNLIVCGIETHICILQTSIDFYNKGYEVFVIDEAVGSRNERHKDIAFNRLIKYGISLINFEMLLFELIRDSKDKSFKEISKYINK